MYACMPESVCLRVGTCMYICVCVFCFNGSYWGAGPWSKGPTCSGFVSAVPAGAPWNMAFTNLDYTALFISWWKPSKSAKRDVGIQASRLLWNLKKNYILQDALEALKEPGWKSFPRDHLSTSPIRSPLAVGVGFQVEGAENRSGNRAPLPPKSDPSPHKPSPKTVYFLVFKISMSNTSAGYWRAGVTAVLEKIRSPQRRRMGSPGGWEMHEIICCLLFCLKYVFNSLPF